MNDEWQGIKIASLVFGLVGAALGISYTPEMTKRQMAAAVLAGITCAGLCPQIVEQWYHLSPIANNLLAFVFGIGGMFIIPGLLTLWRGFSQDPWAWLDRLRGNSPPPGDKP